MRLTLDRVSALRVFRTLRATGRLNLGNRCGLIAPDPSPRSRWTTRILPLDSLALENPPNASSPLQIMSSSAWPRVKAAFANNSVVKGRLPDNAFIEVDEGIAIPCPELLFLRMAGVMPFHVLCLLGYELCGSYSRDAAMPKSGPVTHGLAPVTSPDAIAAFARACMSVHGCSTARQASEHVLQNAWSPMEALVALLFRLPPELLGYGIDRITLNERISVLPGLATRGCRNARIPDILIDGTGIGFNYDGRDHFDLDSIANAGQETEKLRTIHRVRRKYVDDLRRNRELAAMGYTVLPITAEDLNDNGGLDTVVLEALSCAGASGSHGWDNIIDTILDDRLARARQELIWSCIR